MTNITQIPFLFFSFFKPVDDFLNIRGFLVTYSIVNIKESKTLKIPHSYMANGPKKKTDIVYTAHMAPTLKITSIRHTEYDRHLH